jgi:hypothetical protein
MSPARPSHEVERLQAEVTYYRDRIAQLRARLYRRAEGTSTRLEELQRNLESAQKRLRDARHPPAPL